MGIKKKPVFSFNKLAGLLAGLLCIIALNVLLALNKQKTASYAAQSFAQLPLHILLKAKMNCLNKQIKPCNEQLTKIENKVAILQPEKIADAYSIRITV